MAEWVKGCASKPDNLSWCFRVHMVEGKNQLLQLFSDLYMHVVLWLCMQDACTHTHIHT